MTHYKSSFYHKLQGGASSSAKEIVPLVMDLLRPCSVIDVGCGTGVWLYEFSGCGVKDILGIDGSDLDDKMLVISKSDFARKDLAEGIRLNKTFDLVVSLEVAEHLPPESAEGFIESLVSLGPVILFSAAIPRQGGTCHMNEQWPSYWANLFNSYGYIVVDCIRRQIWNNKNVEPWYAQNTFLYIKKECVNNYPALVLALERQSFQCLELVHPKVYLDALSAKELSFTTYILLLPKMLRDLVGRRWQMMLSLMRYFTK